MVVANAALACNEDAANEALSGVTISAYGAEAADCTDDDSCTGAAAKCLQVGDDTESKGCVVLDDLSQCGVVTADSCSGETPDQLEYRAQSEASAAMTVQCFEAVGACSVSFSYDDSGNTATLAEEGTCLDAAQASATAVFSTECAKVWIYTDCANDVKEEVKVGEFVKGSTNLEGFTFVFADDKEDATTCAFTYFKSD